MNENDRFDKFTERARKILSLAQEEAQRFQHNYVGTEHLLLALVRENAGVAAKILANLGVEPSKVRSSVEFVIDRANRVVLRDIGLTPRSKKVIELAVDEARLLNHHYIGTEHLLLGLIREGEGMAASALKSLGVNLENARQALLILSQSAATTETSTAQDLPSVPQEATNNSVKEDSASSEIGSRLSCNTCGSSCPGYFNYCFNCGSKLKSE